MYYTELPMQHPLNVTQASVTRAEQMNYHLPQMCVFWSYHIEERAHLSTNCRWHFVSYM